MEDVAPFATLVVGDPAEPESLSLIAPGEHPDKPPVQNWFLPEDKTQPSIVPLQIIMHSAADAKGPDETNLYHWWQQTNLESHFMVGKRGTIFQYMRPTVRADANYRANRFSVDGKWFGAVSIETENDGDENALWTPAQLDSIIRLINWLGYTYKTIQRRLCPAWNKSGLGWHIMWGAPGAWTPRAKVCPGPRRIEQLNEILLPAFTNGGSAVADQPDPIVEQSQQRIVDAGWGDLLAPYGADGFWGRKSDDALRVIIERAKACEGDTGDEALEAIGREVVDLANQIGGYEKGSNPSSQ